MLNSQSYTKKLLPNQDFLSYKVNTNNQKDLIEEIFYRYKEGNSIVVEGLNIAKFIQANTDSKLKDCLKKCDILHIDGSGISLGIYIIYGKFFKRIAGIDLMQGICKYCKENDYGIYILGGKEHINIKTKKIINKKYKNIVNGNSNGYFKMTNSNLKKLVDKIDNTNTSIIFIGITSPKKEVVAEYIKKNSKKRYILLGVGGSFDVISGEIKRAPIYFQKIGMEWFWRAIKEPKRLMCKYIIRLYVSL